MILGPFRLQPAEFMKLGMILMLARYFHDDHRPGACQILRKPELST